MRMRRLLILSAVLLASCSSSSGPKPADLPRLENPRRVQVLWSRSVGDGGHYVFFPAPSGDAVYGAGRDGDVTRFEAASGRKVWEVRAAKRLSAGPGAGALTVVVATEQGEVIALDAEKGAVRWRARVSSEVLAPPTVSSGLVLVRSIDSRIFAFGENDGKRRWVYQRAAPSLMVRSPAGLTVDGDTAYAGFTGGKLMALALANGGVRWEATVTVPKGNTEIERLSDVVGDPAVMGREVCAAAYQGRVACYEAQSGRQIWVREISSLTGVSLDARYAYVSDDRGAVHALDRSNGRPVWKQDKLSLRQLSLPLPLEDAVVVGDFEGYVHFLSRDSGAFLARYSTGGAPIRSAPELLPARAPGFLVLNQDGDLYALGL
jgi:outer membrane protein assembly factor BamB